MKTILFAKAGFKVEGSDASPEAISHAPELAKEQGEDIKFFLSRYDELGDKCKEKFDCIYSDNFDETEKHEDLEASAKGIYSALKKGGRFVFTGAPVDWSMTDLKNLIEEDWNKRKRFEILPPHEKEGLKVTTVAVTDKTPDGFLVNYIYLIEEQGEMRIEIVPVMDPRIKWTFKDYVGVLEGAGFSKVECVEQDEQIFNIGNK
jgi:SAM-dependent methyltransferase